MKAKDFRGGIGVIQSCFSLNHWRDVAVDTILNVAYAFAYDGAGRLTQVSEPFGVTLQYAYDDEGHQTLRTDSLGGTVASVYDVENQLTRRDYQGHGLTLRVDYDFDALGRAETLNRYSDLGGLTLVADTAYQYDGVGNVTHILSRDGTTATIDEFRYTFDASLRSAPF